jgi:beta-phosphoglucomutase-like phosphatase (HAD superfamily)
VLAAIILDFDGVIVNSEPLHLRAYQSILHEEGIEFSAREYYRDFVGLSDEAIFTRIARKHRGSRDEAWIAEITARKSDRVKALLRSNSPLFPGVAEHVRLLAARWPLALASGALRPEIEQVLGTAGLRDAFVAIVAAGETPRSKPAPDPYLRALASLSAHAGRPLEPASVVGVEDTVQGLLALRAAGLRRIAVTTTLPANALCDAELIVSDITAVTEARLLALTESPGAASPVQ